MKTIGYVILGVGAYSLLKKGDELAAAPGEAVKKAIDDLVQYVIQPLSNNAVDVQLALPSALAATQTSTNKLVAQMTGATSYLDLENMQSVLLTPTTSWQIGYDPWAWNA